VLANQTTDEFLASSTFLRSRPDQTLHMQSPMRQICCQFKNHRQAHSVKDWRYLMKK